MQILNWMQEYLQNTDSKIEILRISIQNTDFSD